MLLLFTCVLVFTAFWVITFILNVVVRLVGNQRLLVTRGLLVCGISLAAIVRVRGRILFHGRRLISLWDLVVLLRGRMASA
jgi:hypothetical protein